MLEQDLQACELQACELQACELQACELKACELQACELQAESVKTGVLGAVHSLTTCPCNKDRERGEVESGAGQEAPCTSMASTFGVYLFHERHRQWG